jgi:hypothetical protein
MQRLRLVALAGFVLPAMASQASAQAVPCTGEILGRAPNQLRTVLQAFCIQPSAEAPLNLDEPVQYAGYNAVDEFVLAYNTVAPSGAVEHPLRIVRLDKLNQTWTGADFPDIETEILPNLKGQCLGAVGDLQKVGPRFYVGIELSPSAGCVAVVSTDLKLQVAISGGIIAKVPSGPVIVEGSTRHFAPTHPLRLSMFSPRDGSIKSIYPVENDPFRARYIQRLRTEVSPADRCEGENCELDPEQFDNELANICYSTGCKPAIAVNDETESLAFIVQFSPIGFIRLERVKDSPEWDEQAVFVYRFLDGTVDHREFAASEMQTRFGITSIDALLAPEVLKRVFGAQ